VGDQEYQYDKQGRVIAILKKGSGCRFDYDGKGQSAGCICLMVAPWYIDTTF